METLTTVLTALAIALCMVAVSINCNPVQKLLKAKLNDTQLDTVRKFTKSCVEYAEQWLSTKTGQEKKAVVVDKVIEKAFELGIEISQSDVEVFIEAACKEIK